MLKIMYQLFTAPSFTMLAVSKKFFWAVEHQVTLCIHGLATTKICFKTRNHFLGAWSQYEPLSVSVLNSLTCPSIVFCRWYII